jgi:hypothetical protein
MGRGERAAKPFLNRHINDRTFDGSDQVARAAAGPPPPWRARIGGLPVKESLHHYCPGAERRVACARIETAAVFNRKLSGPWLLSRFPFHQLVGGIGFFPCFHRSIPEIA